MSNGSAISAKANSFFIFITCSSCVGDVERNFSGSNPEAAAVGSDRHDDGDSNRRVRGGEEVKRMQSVF